MSPNDSFVCPDCGENLVFKAPWETLIAVARQTLEHYYPKHIFTGKSGDIGPRFTAKLHEALDILKELPDDSQRID